MEHPSSRLPQLIYSSLSPVVQLRQSSVEQVGGGAAHSGEDLMTLPDPTVHKHIHNEHLQSSTDKHLKMAAAWLSGWTTISPLPITTITTLSCKGS